MLDKLHKESNDVVRQRLLLKPLTEVEKLQVFKQIRWSFMSHEELVETSLDRDFELARPMILEGLSCRLVNFEKSSKLGSLVNLTPRTKYPKEQVRELPEKQPSPVKQSNPYATRGPLPVFSATANDKWATTMPHQKQIFGGSERLAQSDGFVSQVKAAQKA